MVNHAMAAPSEFLLTRPSRGATEENGNPWDINSFLLTRPSRGATDYACAAGMHKPISTHTPLAGRNEFLLGLQRRLRNFYSHAPRGAQPVRHVP